MLKYEQYLLALRLKSSLMLLQDDTLSVSEIALKCGFESASNYISHFRKAYGKTPGEYRKAASAGTITTHLNTEGVNL